MATSNLIYLSVRAVLEKQNHSADILGICKVSGRTFFPSPMDKHTVSLQTLLFSIFFFLLVDMTIVCIHMSLGYMLISTEHCTPWIIFLAETDHNLRGQMSSQKK